MIDKNRYNYTSRTQMPITNVVSEALRLRTTGISKVRQLIKHCSTTTIRIDRDAMRSLIASMNYSVTQCQKELKRRNVKGDK